MNQNENSQNKSLNILHFHSISVLMWLLRLYDGTMLVLAVLFMLWRLLPSPS